MSDVDDLVTWLRAQLDDDERVAGAADSSRWLPEDKGITFEYIADDFHEGEAQARLAADTRANQEHIARHDPARVLAEVERTRKLIRRYELAAGASTALVSFTRGQDDGYRQACLDAIRDAAEIYADRPGYRDEWAPSASA